MRSCASRRAAVALGVFAAAALAASPSFAQTKKSFKVAWSVFAGYMPLGYAADSGILQKWADKHGVAIELVKVNDYVDSVKQYAEGKFDAAPMTNMDALTIPVAAGVDSTALFVIDFSNGADGVVLKDGTTVADLKGRKVNLVQYSVSHYLLARALETAKLTEQDVTIVDTSATNIAQEFAASPEVTAVATWNPQLSMAATVQGAREVFSTRQLPGEIVDFMVVNTKVLDENPGLGKALTGAWYEVMVLLETNNEQAIGEMGWASGTDAQGYLDQLKTLKMFYKPAEAAAFVSSLQLPKTMESLRTFSFAQKLLGEGAATKDTIGISFPGGKALGDAQNVKLRFTADYMTMAAQGGM